MPTILLYKRKTKLKSDKKVKMKCIKFFTFKAVLLLCYLTFFVQFFCLSRDYPRFKTSTRVTYHVDDVIPLPASTVCISALVPLKDLHLKAFSNETGYLERSYNRSGNWLDLELGQKCKEFEEKYTDAQNQSIMRYHSNIKAQLGCLLHYTVLRQPIRATVSFERNVRKALPLLLKLVDRANLYVEISPHIVTLTVLCSGLSHISAPTSASTSRKTTAYKSPKTVVILSALFPRIFSCSIFTGFCCTTRRERRLEGR